MDKEDLKYYVITTTDFDNIDEAFDDYVYDLTISEIIDLLDDEMKEKILLDSPSYIKRNEKYYFNGEFISLEEEEIDKIIKNYEDKKEEK